MLDDNTVATSWTLRQSLLSNTKSSLLLVVRMRPRWYNIPINERVGGGPCGETLYRQVLRIQGS